MTESRRKSVCILSWADEVEKEEEEEAQADLLCQTKTQKPNPFGSARPREVVLKERGIDWRVIDHGQGLLQLPFSDSIKKHSNGKPRREIVSNMAFCGVTRNPEQVLVLAPPVPVSHCNQIPIRCPTGNGILKWVEKPCISPNICRGSSNRYEPEKENMGHEHRLQRDHCAKSSDSRTHKGPFLNGKIGEHGSKAKLGQEKRRRRWSNVASIKDGTTSIKELCDSSVPRCVPAGIELKKLKMSNTPDRTMDDLQSFHVVAGESGQGRVGRHRMRRNPKKNDSLIRALN
ncbi:uncharacterized protein LOC115708082 [Cannabis sativa]|uniref:Uncharacterized protein n=2 Tax=Cannabis sativa TaxID=3483 RepID=A0AB40E9V9_CANSA|nr:uncharacterized protein LOC115708082 [Cannabis sativa]KAF4364529.1 hypothetical protein G4B88_012111 [Cannabis sativa]